MACMKVLVLPYPLKLCVPFCSCLYNLPHGLTRQYSCLFWGIVSLYISTAKSRSESLAQESGLQCSMKHQHFVCVGSEKNNYCILLCLFFVLGAPVPSLLLVLPAQIHHFHCQFSLQPLLGLTPDEIFELLFHLVTFLDGN